jgi:hypothetical protein
MKMTGLGSKIAAVKNDLGRLEATIAEKRKEKTVRQIATERINDKSRWGASADDPASTLRDTPPGKGEAKPHRFEAMVDMIAERDGVSKPVAAGRARKEFPDLFDDYRNSVGVAKSSSYDQLVDNEIQKGCSVVVARQRVAYAHPELARESLAKSENGVAEFMTRVSEIKKRDGCSRVEAMIRARREHPAAYARFENV